MRPRLSCRCCERIVQMPAPSRPIDRGIPGPGLLAHVLVSKYADHLPLYRQSGIYAREGVELDRSTLADWVGSAAGLLDPLVKALARHVLAADKLHADDTPVPVLQPGRGTTRTGRLWTYVRDDRPAADTAPAAVWFDYSPDRKGIRPIEHLKRFVGILQADGYAGFDRLYETGRIVEAACWAHVRRKFYDLHQATASPLAAQAIRRIGALYEIEREIRGRPPDERCAVRQARAGPQLDALRQWLQASLSTVSAKSALAVAIRYALTRWAALTRYVGDGRIEIDNNAAERALRDVALGRKNYLFAGSDAGGDRAAVPMIAFWARPNSTGSIPKATCVRSSNASPITRSTASTNCCRGTSNSLASPNCARRRSGQAGGERASTRAHRPADRRRRADHRRTDPSDRLRCDRTRRR